MSELQTAFTAYFSDPFVFADVLNVHLHRGIRIFLPEYLACTKPPIFCRREENRFLLFQNDLSMNYEEEGAVRTRYLLDFCLNSEPSMLRCMNPEEAVILPESFMKRTSRSEALSSGTMIRLLFYVGKPLKNIEMRNDFIPGQMGSEGMTPGILFPEEAEDCWFDSCTGDYRFVGRILKYRNEKKIAESLVKSFLRTDPKDVSVWFLETIFEALHSDLSEELKAKTSLSRIPVPAAGQTLPRTHLTF